MLIFAPNLTEAMAMKQRLTILLMVTLTLLTFACSHPDEEPTQKSETPTEPVVKPDTTQTTKPDTTQTTKPDHPPDACGQHGTFGQDDVPPEGKGLHLHMQRQPI